MMTTETLALEQLSIEAADLRRRTELAVFRCRAAGATWADIGEALAMTRQAAHERFRHVTLKHDDRYVTITCECGAVSRTVSRPAPAVTLRCPECRTGQ